MRLGTALLARVRFTVIPRMNINIQARSRTMLRTITLYVYHTRAFPDRVIKAKE